MPLVALVALVAACGPADGPAERRRAAFDTSGVFEFTDLPNIVRHGSTAYEPSWGGGVVADDPPPPAPASAIDPNDPWSALGPLTGRYELTVERLEHDCSFGPDVPLSRHVERWSDGSIETTWRTEQTYYPTLVQRGDALAFELGEGVVFARWNEALGLVEDVERTGPEGVTHYVDGFRVRREAEGFVIEGESDWAFDDEFYAPGETCSGRTRWRAEQTLPRPSSGSRDLQIVLRWPSSSAADLDLMVTPPEHDADERADFVAVEHRCYSLRSTGRVLESDISPYGDFVADLADSSLPYHEEVIRCSAAPWGLWHFDVMSWSGDETVDLEIEVFWGPRVNTTRDGERSYGVVRHPIDPLGAHRVAFVLSPPPSDRSSAGLIELLVGGDLRLQAEREPGPWTATYLEFRKAALAGISFDEFVERIAPSP
jgi:hypothetical protein